MLRHVTKLGLIAVILGVFVPEASAFRHCGWRGCCGYAGCGYYGCGYGGCGYAYGGYYGYGYAGYYGGGYYGWGPVGYPAPTAYPAPAAPAAVAPLSDGASLPADRVGVVVTVPADAKVYVNGHLTKSTGERRQYSSGGLKPESSYEYQVRAEYIRDGKPVREEKTVLLTAGKSAALVFNATPTDQLAGVSTNESR
jgi:uncharacterized protein (TIGR03000 family)